MDADKVSAMYAQIVNGVTKEDCPSVTDDESGAVYDSIAADVKAARDRGQTTFEMINP